MQRPPTSSGIATAYVATSGVMGSCRRAPPHGNDDGDANRDPVPQRPAEIQREPPRESARNRAAEDAMKTPSPTSSEVIWPAGRSVRPMRIAQRPIA